MQHSLRELLDNFISPIRSIGNDELPYPSP